MLKLAVLAVAAAAPACADTAVWVQARSSSHAATFRGHGELLSALSNAHAATSLLGLRPTGEVSAAQSEELNSLLLPDVLARPSTLLSVQLVGAPAGVLQALSAVESVSVVARPLVGSSAAVAAALQPLPGLLLDTECNAACDAACLAQALGLEKLGGLEAPSAQPLLRELSCLLAAARAQADSAEPLLSARLVALPALLAASPESGEAAGAALARTIAAALLALDKRAGGAVAQLVLLEEMPQQPLRRLLQSSTDAAPPPPPAVGGYRDLNAWYGKVAGFGVGVLVATAAVGAVIALCTLPTGQDALLYARTKGD